MPKHTWIIPLVVLLVVAYLSAFIDMPIEKYFYDPSTETSFTENSLIDFIYRWGVFPAQVVGVGSLIVLLLSYVKASWKAWRKPALLLVLTMAVGAGFITHTLLKDQWGRPRPRQVIELGGDKEFRPIYSPNFFQRENKSFPSGHATMGFYFFTFIFLGRRLSKPWLVYLGVALSIILGTALGLTRMAQGGHFFSDIIASGVVMWLTALVFDWVLFSDDA